MAKAAAVKKAPTKSEVYASISETTGLTKRQVATVVEALSVEIQKSLGKKGSGQFTIPGLCKITVTRKPATKERKGINPFTKEETVFKAKPARNVVKIRPLKGLKDMV
jgi:nucleoid DNA-binding protein